jgi:hypothetical protein
LQSPSSFEVSTADLLHPLSPPALSLSRRALLAHKDTLSCTRDLWKLLLKKELKAERIDEAIATLDNSTARSQRIYKK